MEREQITKQMQEWCDNMCENACLKGESLNGRVHTCEICFPNTVKNALLLIKELTEENERLREKADRNLENLKSVLDERSESNIVADTVKKMQNEIEALFPSDKNFTTISRFTVRQIAREMLEGV